MMISSEKKETEFQSFLETRIFVFLSEEYYFFSLNRAADQCNNSAEQVFLNSYPDKAFAWLMST